MKKFATFCLLLLCSIRGAFSVGRAIAAESGAAQDNRVVIYSGAESYRNEYFVKRLKEQFPNYDIALEYMPTGNLAAKLAAEGDKTDMDIFYDFDFSYVGLVEQYFADLSDYDQSIYVEDCKVKSNKYLTEYRNSGAIILNPTVLKEKGLPEPTCYEDLIKPEYKGLISMPDPKSSGTGYMFVKNLVNVWGEKRAFDYFDALAENVLQFTSSGSGPVNALVQGEVAIGLGMTGQAVIVINQGADLKIVFFKEGSPYCLYGYGMPEGKQHRTAVKAVFDFFYNHLVAEDKALFFPEQIFINQKNEVKNYPVNIPYGDMSGNTTEEKMRLLENWDH